MSGHNKWSKIKHKKAASDANKSKVFSKLVKLIQNESKACGGDVNSPGLRSAIEKAKKESMPADNIERAIKKGQDKDLASLELVTYESYGPGGAGIIIEALTSNRNKTAAEVRHILSKNNLALASTGSVSWSFTKADGSWIANSETEVEISKEDGEKLEKILDEFDENEDVQEVYTNVK